MDVSAFNEVEESRVNMVYRARLWRAIHEWGELVDHWVKSPFEMIEVSEISKKSDAFTKTVLQCERYLP